MKIYLVILEKIKDERCSIVTIHRTEESAKKAKLEYENNCTHNKLSFKYYIKEIDLESEDDIIFDCVEEENTHFFDYE